MRRALAIAAVLLLACGARPVVAQNYCTAYASSLAFGNYNPGTAGSVTATITVTCAKGLAYHIALNAGMASSATVTTRKMTGANSATLAYSLFSDAARTINWGNSTGTNWVTGTGANSPQTYTIYARLPAGESVAPGTFTDTITASITSSAPSTTAQFSVTATVQPSCLISTTALNFGVYARALVNATSTVTVTCTNSTTFNVGLNAGVGSAATVTSRKITSPASATLKYSLFRNSARTQNWGNTVGTDTVAGTGNGAAQSITAYGQMAAGQSGNPAVYTDTITATVTY
jgi:spore coat protein U-like protein